MYNVVYQSINDPHTGDCFSACLATMLGLKLDQIPNFLEGSLHSSKDMIGDAIIWLRKNFSIGLVVVDCQLPNMNVIARAFPLTEMIGSYQSPNHPNTPEARHGVIVRTTAARGRFELVHDPNKDGKKIRDIDNPLHLYILAIPHPRVYSFHHKGPLSRLVRDNRIEENKFNYSIDTFFGK